MVLTVVNFDKLPENFWRFQFIFANDFLMNFFKIWSMVTLPYRFSKTTTLQAIKFEIYHFKVEKCRGHVANH